jgi:type IV secretory pathway VirD2 relaxase
VVVKAHVVKMTAYGAKAARLHLRYIERDGVEQHGSRGRLYGPDGPAEGIDEPRPRERHQFRLIVSPEDAAEMDLTKYVQGLMAQVEKDLGRRIEWAAVNHYNTDHPHAHVVVRGVDQDGNALRLPRQYIAETLRRRAQELATRELGPRVEHDVQRAHAKEVTRDRFTALDAELERRAEGGVVALPGPRPKGRSAGIDDRILLARLEHLEAMRLAERTPPNRWALTEGWSAQLRDMGARGDIIRQMHLALQGDPARYHIVRAAEALEPTAAGSDRPLVARVAAKGLADELRGGYYAVLETPGGAGYHVPIDGASAERLRVGDLVSVAATAADTPGDAPGRSSRLVVRKHELGLEEQVAHPGPTPLDRIERAALAPYGLGAEVRRALERRDGELRRLGVDPADPRRDAMLRELERRAIAERVAARSGQSVLAELRAPFRGRVDVSERGADGTAYAVVSDGARVVVVQATPALWRANGRSAMVSKDPDGTWRVRSLDKDRDR